jgi:hypothetical protein
MRGICDGKTAITGAEIEEMDTATPQNQVWDVDVFARTSPEHKLRLVKAIQANQQIVAMTGGGPGAPGPREFRIAWQLDLFRDIRSSHARRRPHINGAQALGSQHAPMPGDGHILLIRAPEGVDTHSLRAKCAAPSPIADR